MYPFLGGLFRKKSTTELYGHSLVTSHVVVQPQVKCIFRVNSPVRGVNLAVWPSPVSSLQYRLKWQQSQIPDHPHIWEAHCTDKSVIPPRPDIPWSWGSQTGGSFRLRLRKENFEHFPSIRAICVSKCRDKQGNSRVELAFYHRRPHQLCVPNKLTSPTLPLNDLVSIYFLLLSNWQKTWLNWATCPSAVIRTQIP